MAKKDPSLWESAKAFFETMDKFFMWVKGVYEWFKDFPQHVLDGTVTLLTKLYGFLSDFMLGVPSELFSSEWFTNASLVFGAVGFLTSILLGKYEGLKQVITPPGSTLSKNHMELPKLIKRVSIATIGAGFAPKLFEKTFEYLDMVTSAIIYAGKEQIEFSLIATNIEAFGWIDAIALLLFDVAFIGMMFPLAMQMFKRYFDLLALGALTPLALATWVYEEHQGYFEKWLDSIKSIVFMMFYYSIFLTIMGMLILGINGTETFKGLIIKLGIMLGGIWRMANPPSEFKKHLDHGKDVYSLYSEVKDHLLLRNFRDSKGFKAITKPLTLTKKEKEKIKLEKDQKRRVMNHKHATSKLDRMLLWEIIKDKFKK